MACLFCNLSSMSLAATVDKDYIFHKIVIILIFCFTLIALH